MLTSSAYGRAAQDETKGGRAQAMPAYGWTREDKEHESLIYRHRRTGCTLHKISRVAANGEAAWVWVLFARRYELLEIFDRPEDSLPPFANADALLHGITAEEYEEPMLPSIDFSRTYKWSSNDE